MKKLILIGLALILTSGFTFGQKLKKGNLIGYYTSYDIHKSESFVGYAGIIY